MPLGIGSTVEVRVHINAPSSRVWKDIADISTHIEWMDDAEQIKFIGSKRQGVGTAFTCITKLGRFRTDDHVIVTEWNENRRMSIQHDGLVQGNGSFILTPSGTGTDFSWEESLLFPLALGGPAGEFFAKPLLRRTWRNNLASLKDRIEGPPGVNPIRFFAERGITLQVKGKAGAWKVSLHASDIKDFDIKDYAEGASPFGARAAAVHRWLEEEEPNGRSH
jgi:hypothetical protein